MTEAEKLVYAKFFIDNLANGINPLDNTPIHNDSVINNVRISRCFFYVSSILEKAICRERIGERAASKTTIAPFFITQEQTKGYVYSSAPIPVTMLAKRISSLARDEIEAKRMRSLSYRQIITWLLNIGMIEYRELENGKRKRFPTQNGEEIGLVLVEYDRHGRHVPVIYYSEEAQRFIIDNIEAVIATEIKKGKTSYPYGLEERDGDEAEETEE